MVLREEHPTGCALAAPPPIDGNHIVADTGAENAYDLARREAASAASACWARALIDRHVEAYTTDLEVIRATALGRTTLPGITSA